MMDHMHETIGHMHDGMRHEGGMDMGGMMGWMWLWLVVGLLVLVALVAVAVWVVRRTTGQPGSAEARRILEERLARGEIDVEEFRHRSAVLDRG